MSATRGFTRRTIATLTVFVVLGGSSVVLLVPNIMMSDAPGSDRIPLVVAVVFSSMLAPVAFLVGLIVLVPAGYYRLRILIGLATVVPLLVFAVMVTSLLLLFFWCGGQTVGGAGSRLGCGPF